MRTWWNNWSNSPADARLPVTPQVVLARGREEGFRYVLKPESTVLVGTRKHLWRTAEETPGASAGSRRPQGGAGAHR